MLARPAPARRPRMHAACASVCAVLLALALLAPACSGGAERPPAPPQSSQPGQPPEQSAAAQQQTEPPPVQRLPLTAEDLGGHLEATEFGAGLIEWLTMLPDPLLAALPRRALGDDGRAFSPSAASTTGETFWGHVITDVSAESAAEWVRYLAGLPPAAALSFTSPDNDLFEARVRPAPALGAAAHYIELLHGHSGGRFRTEVIIFAQDAAVVFLRSSRRAERPSLTDLPAVARLISARLAEPAAAEPAAPR